MLFWPLFDGVTETAGVIEGNGTKHKCLTESKQYAPQPHDMCVTLIIHM